MQFKNIIFSAALLAMVSAAPIETAPTDATEGLTTPEFNYKNCADIQKKVDDGSFATPYPTTQHQIFIDKCNECLDFFGEDPSSWYDVSEDSPEFQHLEKEFAYCGAEDSLNARNDVSSLTKGTGVDAPKAGAGTPALEKGNVEPDTKVNTDEVTKTQTPAVKPVEIPAEVPKAGSA
ncbi:hypothetical protein DFP73DRAFT_632061 [Morchella snyderi]|nr:hypothetical protein DFP73DRAFT_632061 [Morchella snyderi]